MKRIIILLIYFLICTIEGYSQSNSNREHVILIQENINESHGYEHTKKLTFSAIYPNVKIIATSNLSKSDSIFDISNNAIRIKQRWEKCIGQRHCFGDWTTGQIWQIKYRLQIKKDSNYVEYIIESPLDYFWVIESYFELNLETQTISKPIYIMSHTFHEHTENYLDSISIEYGYENITSFLDFIKSISKDQIESNYIRLKSTGTFIDEILKVEYEYIEPKTNRIIRKDVRQYILNRKEKE